MKTKLLLIISLFPILSLAQSVGDTIIVPTFNYSQTHSPNGRDTMIQFPDNPDIGYEKIIMLYNMRCKDGLVSQPNPGQTNIGCGEWDYSCNTFITDSSRVDSAMGFKSSHTITGFSGEIYEYTDSPTFTFYQYDQKDVVVNNIVSENQAQVGTGNLPLDNVIAPENHSGKSQYLISQAELNAAGAVAGDLSGLLVNILNGNGKAGFLKVRIKHSEKMVLTNTSPDTSEFTEVYFRDYQFNTGSNRFQFYTPFVWNGSSNLIIEFSLSNTEIGSFIEIEGTNTGAINGLYAINGYSLNGVNGQIDVPTTSFGSIDEKITISFWSYGNEYIQPSNNSIISGIDDANNRQINVHLPWSNSNIYFDCGNDGTGYDRIDKTATPSEFEGQWNQWAFTKNAVSGEMKIYLNGVLWHSGTDKYRMIDIQNFIIGNLQNSSNRYYYGKIDEVRIWNAELSEQQISEWMNKSVDVSHPNWNNLVAYYKLDEGTGSTVMDASVANETGIINGYMYWVFERGENLSRGFEETSERPNLTFLQGEYELNIEDIIVMDSVPNTPNVVTEYAIVHNWGTMKHDSIATVSINEYWEAIDQNVYDPEGNLIGTIPVEPTGEITITELTYYNRWPAKFEIMSFVTPYGILLDLGMEGKTWAFDVTDYSPILTGLKRMTIERGGQRQEDMDIRFVYIVGTPGHDVLDINQIWDVRGSKSWSNIIDNRVCEPRDILLNENGEYFKIRSVITGHGQQGEFIARQHFINLNGGDNEYEWTLWTECSTIPIYPQGGTWIYDRAGWCPGDPSDLYEFNISQHVTPGETVNIDYGLEFAFGTSNYLVNNQLVTYGPANFAKDGAIININKPNGEIAAHERFNPACSDPIVTIRNNGSSTLSGLKITYKVEGGEELSQFWYGSLEFMQKVNIVLNIPNYSFWTSGTDNIFTASISPILGSDEYPYNDSYSIEFVEVDTYENDQDFVIECKTNNYGHQTYYELTDIEGNTILERDDLDDNTIYTDELTLAAGCYKLRIDDRADDGLYWWHSSTQGTGYFRLKNASGETLYNFEPEFGRFAIYEFAVVNLTGVGDNNRISTSISVYPNPTSGIVNVELEGFKANNLIIKVMNTSMSEILIVENSISSDAHKEVINISTQPAGVYFLHIQCREKTVVRKIVKY